MKNKFMLLLVLVLLFQLCIPVLAKGEGQEVLRFPTQIYMERVRTYQSFEQAPDEILVQKWENGVFYRGTIPKISYVQEEPGKAIVTYGGYIPYDPSVIPNSLEITK